MARKILCVAAAGLLLGGGEAAASGFALKEQSASLQGTAFAGSAAAAADASTIFFNPAGMTSLSGNAATAVGSYIMPQAEFSGTGTRAAALGGGQISGGTSGDAAVDAFVPAVYAMWSATPDLKLGLGINAPWGLTTEFDADWVGRYHAIKSEMRTINIQPSVAYRVAPTISVAAGLQFQYVEAELSQAIDFGSILAAGGVPVAPGSLDGTGVLEGSDWGFGWVAGLMFEPADGTRFGLSYRSSVTHTLEGDARFSGVPAVGALPAVFANTTGKAKLETPPIVSFGAYHELTDRWAVMGDVAWTGWSTFKELRVDYANPLRADSVTEEHWEDSWFFALGAAYRASDDLTLRFGTAYDESPVPDAYRTPRIPDQDRVWLSAGASYRLMPSATVSASYTHIFVDDASIGLTDDLTGAEAFRGNLTGSFENSIDIISVQLDYTF